MKHWESVLYLVYISLWNYRFVVLAFYYVLYALIVWGYQLFNVVLSSLLLTAFNTHIRVMTNTLIRVLPVTLIWVLGHTLIWISSNNLYMVYHCLIVLMLYILSFIAAMAWRFVCHVCCSFYFDNSRFGALPKIVCYLFSYMISFVS